MKNFIEVTTGGLRCLIKKDQIMAVDEENDDKCNVILVPNETLCTVETDQKYDKILELIGRNL